MAQENLEEKINISELREVCEVNVLPQINLEELKRKEYFDSQILALEGSHILISPNENHLLAWSKSRKAIEKFYGLNHLKEKGYRLLYNPQPGDYLIGIG